ncbi:MAG TPA: GNAT family N-acetyltransferase [Nocardioidaceae bacterium]|nr:GNAT family N-acetyltransferase [Nocardioidaceae bacterium]
MHLRPATDADVDAVLALNAASVEALSPLDAHRLRRLRSASLRYDVVETEGSVAAFVLVFGPGADYDSDNYHWFAQAYDDFCYLDRIVVGEQWRRRGVGRLVYEEMEAVAAPHGRLTCEVNAEPPNHASLAFHAARGYAEVGRLGHGAGKVTAMLSKELPG